MPTFNVRFYSSQVDSVSSLLPTRVYILTLYQGIYPTAIVVLVTLQETAWDERNEHPYMKTIDMQFALAPTLLTHHSRRHQRSKGVDQIESHRSTGSSDDGFQDATSSAPCALSSTTDLRASAVSMSSPAESPAAPSIETHQRVGLQGWPYTEGGRLADKPTRTHVSILDSPSAFTFDDAPLNAEDLLLFPPF
ncbi:hypothetical protein HETIRDRAFT_109041 [Heterobasidion irregulare TC 32-1]|uniref:Uncharacterized protein n=1 Tax=Heterobasidion irregulare (strain TC 32-1) TaxID=747525 RepID=W4JXY8_HETIT|nr:uncharacterized protein HETIRDRAFT_109041 [Heterobasidion irregulare TC 32-1]ETW78447.1 hypothetical protein HETIRDRAFT_109041 [Heterobasidion irregulare TC 32-1]